jgi:hypothetical protein
MTLSIRCKIARYTEWERPATFAARVTLQARIVQALRHLYPSDLEAVQDIAPVFADLVDGRSPRRAHTAPRTKVRRFR